MPSFLEKLSRIRALPPLLVVAASAWLAYRLHSEHVISVFTDRDLYRAQELLQGRFPLWGPETNAGGSLIGPFYYYLLAIPGLFGPSVGHVQTFFSAMGFVGFALMGGYLLRTAGLGLALALFGALATSYFGHELSNFWNPSLMPPFAGAALWGMERWYATGGRSWAFLAVLAAALAVQVHGTGWFLLAAVLGSLFLVPGASAARARKLALPVLGGLALPFVFHLPALLLAAGEVREGPVRSVSLLRHVFAQELPSLEALARQNLPVILAPLLAALFAVPKGAEPSLRFLRIAVLLSAPGLLLTIFLSYGQRYGFLHWLLGAVLVLRLLKGRLRDARVLTVVALALVEISVWVFFHRGMMRSFFPAPWTTAALAALFLCAVPASRFRAAWLGAFAAGVAFLSPLLVGATHHRQESYVNRSTGRYMRVNEMRKVTKLIRTHTCWPPAEARARIYLHPMVKLDPSSGFYTLLANAKSLPCGDGQGGDGHRIDGMMIAPLGTTAAALQGDTVLTPAAKRFFATQVEESFTEDIPRHDLTLLFYRLKQPGQQFSNLGLGYQELMGARTEAITERRRKLGSAPSLVELAADGRLRFLWNACHTEPRDCDGEVWVRYRRGGLEVEVDSFRWSVSSRWMDPDHAGMLIRPAISVACDGKETSTVLVDNLGNLTMPGGRDARGPLRLWLPLGCPPARVTALGFHAEKEILIGEAGLFDEREDRRLLEVPALRFELGAETRKTFFGAR